MIDPELLRRLRNDLPMPVAIAALGPHGPPHKRSEGYFRFLCPRCGEMRATVNPRNNLAHCFTCKKKPQHHRSAHLRRLRLPLCRRRPQTLARRISSRPAPNDRCDATGKTGKTIHAADPMPPMTAAPLCRQNRVTIRPSKRAQAIPRRRQNQLPKTRLSTNVRRATRPTPSQRPIGRAPAPPEFSGIRQSARQHPKIHTPLIRLRMRSEFGSGQLLLQEKPQHHRPAHLRRLRLPLRRRPPQTLARRIPSQPDPNRCDATGKTGKTIHVADPMPPMTAAPLGRHNRVTIRPNKRAKAMRRRR
jgi:hypothetical protein